MKKKVELVIMKPKMGPMWRCTRPDQYWTHGRRDPAARKGYYVHAPSAEEAVKVLQKQFPAERIDVVAWSSHAS